MPELRSSIYCSESVVPAHAVANPVVMGDILSPRAPARGAGAKGAAVRRRCGQRRPLCAGCPSNTSYLVVLRKGPLVRQAAGLLVRNIHLIKAARCGCVHCRDNSINVAVHGGPDRIAKYSEGNPAGLVPLFVFRVFV